LSNIQIPEAFEDLFTPARYKVFYGGRGGAKSWNFARALIVTAYKNKTRILCAREIQKSIADSVHKLLRDQIYELGLDGFFEIYQKTITGINGSEFIFEGLHLNVRQIKSKEGIDIVWVEEAEKVSDDSWSFLIPTIRKDGSEIWVSFNPDSEEDPTYRRFITSPPDGAIIRKVGYKENPFFPEVLKKEMEYDKRVDYDRYMHVWEGHTRTISDAQVFKGKFRSDVFDTPEGATFYLGADWGFSQDPSVLVRAFIKDGRLWIDHEAYGVGVDIDDTPTLFDVVPDARKWMITADSARPETISYMQRHGYKMRSAKKGKGSVDDGVSFLRSFEEIVAHERCKHTLYELRHYSYKTDRLTGDVLPILEDKHNHCIDALRYGIEKIMLSNRMPTVTAVIRR